MFIEVVVYEVVTTIGSYFGMKVVQNANLNDRMKSFNQPKRIPIVDSFLVKKLGPMTKTETYVSTKLVNLISKVSSYQAAQYLLILAARKAREASNKSRLEKDNGSPRSSRWANLASRILVS